MSTNVMEMSACRDLDWIIARMAGWKIEPRNGMYAVYRPDGSLGEVGAGTEGSAKTLLPHYSTSVDAMLALLGEAKLTLSQRAGHWSAQVATYYQGEADTPALALCRAWLGWRES
jgi:hypothetical protein